MEPFEINLQKSESIVQNLLLTRVSYLYIVQTVVFYININNFHTSTLFHVLQQLIQLHVSANHKPYSGYNVIKNNIQHIQNSMSVKTRIQLILLHKKRNILGTMG